MSKCKHCHSAAKCPRSQACLTIMNHNGRIFKNECVYIYKYIHILTQCCVNCCCIEVVQLCTHTYIHFYVGIYIYANIHVYVAVVVLSRSIVFSCLQPHGL